MSSKNTLQEYCQKNKIPLPAYNTTKINGSDHQPVFESIVIFQNKTYSAIGASKTISEKDVATLVCQNLFPVQVSTQEISLTQRYLSLHEIDSDKYDKIYLIDGDNCHIKNELVFNEQKALYIYFVAKNNTKPQPINHQQKYENCCIFISQSISKDSVDHLITYYLGKISVIWRNKEYFILTKDHFGECLEKFHENCKLICSL